MGGNEINSNHLKNIHFLSYSLQTVNTSNKMGMDQYLIYISLLQFLNSLYLILLFYLYNACGQFHIKISKYHEDWSPANLHYLYVHRQHKIPMRLREQSLSDLKLSCNAYLKNQNVTGCVELHKNSYGNCLNYLYLIPNQTFLFLFLDWS